MDGSGPWFRRQQAAQSQQDTGPAGEAGRPIRELIEESRLMGGTGREKYSRRMADAEQKEELPHLLRAAYGSWRINVGTMHVVDIK